MVVAPLWPLDVSKAVMFVVLMAVSLQPFARRLSGKLYGSTRLHRRLAGSGGSLHEDVVVVVGWS